MHSPIKSFRIEKLFSDRDIGLDFDSNVAILVDPNGSGKTTFIRALVLILTRRWVQLSQIPFEAAEVVFHNGKALRVERSECEEYLENASMSEKIAAQFSKAEINYLRNTLLRGEESNLTRRAQRYVGMSRSQFRNFLVHSPRQQQLLFEETVPSNFARHEETLDESYPLETIYFPTYRRVEAALSLVEDDDDERGSDDMSIHFGMNDVSSQVQRVTSDIRSSFVESYARISGQMLTQLIDGIHVEPDDIAELASSEYIEIVLERLGENISKEDKSKLLDLVRSDKIQAAHFKPLVYFVGNLMAVYREQREKDEAIKRFATVVNRYLNEKEVIYNESKVSLQIRNTRTGNLVEFQHLSSGEKQVVSIFSRLHLNEDRDVGVFFDEPELSLSIEWQRQLLADIYQSDTCKFVLAATHSPFIYENDLDLHATTLSVSFHGGDQ
ncbi:AAA family ATPase [Allorhodopirellula solitaria]|uniref:Endonuclease GajA/Old nuclease/RecF-like AAA domain-containing protein n=1 Tax=Allorhodopirellula solitaria TaxID=2527987 RepID=A0A5C5YJ41_9BACT|nr:AAA family ATPase [Allorhodopirellula solitaria]TWT74883.1 hypothetical protein CA85_01690 [Allorhodopirellula solitaria]